MHPFHCCEGVVQPEFEDGKWNIFAARAVRINPQQRATVELGLIFKNTYTRKCEFELNWALSLRGGLLMNHNFNQAIYGEPLFLILYNTNTPISPAAHAHAFGDKNKIYIPQGYLLGYLSIS